MTRRVEIGVWAVTLALIVAAVVGWRSTGLASATPHVRLPAAPSLTPAPSGSRLGVLASRIVARNPFRLDRKPASIAYGSASLAIPGAPMGVPRPPLMLSGVFGPPWQAVLEGIPGKQGSVVARVGDAFGELRIRSIRRDTVVVQGADTTWKLTVRRTW